MKTMNLTWNEGAPERLEPGMILRYQDGRLSIIGTHFEQSLDRATFGVATQWSRLVEGYQIEWLANMANRKFGGGK